MRVQKAVITAAAPYQRTLGLQLLIDHDGAEKSVLQIIVGHIRAAGIHDIGIVVHPGDEKLYAEAAGEAARGLTFITQYEARGYGHAIYCAREFAAGQAFLHVVGDHVYVTSGGSGCARRLVETAEREHCAVSAVQPTRETLLAQFGAVAGPRLGGEAGLYRIATVLEKPTPTEAEQALLVTGVRAGHYLCFFGMHVLTPAVFEILGELLSDPERRVTLSDALAELARRERYLALSTGGLRYNLGARYGFLMAQLALAMHGEESSSVLTRVLEVVATRETAAADVFGA